MILKNEKGNILCPACYHILDFWNCKAVCHNCGLQFTCDE